MCVATGAKGLLALALVLKKHERKSVANGFGPTRRVPRAPSDDDDDGGDSN